MLYNTRAMLRASPVGGPLSTRYLLFLRTILVGTLLLEALYAPDASRTMDWIALALPIYGICSFALWGLERFRGLYPPLAQASFLLDLGLVASATYALPTGSGGVFVAFFLVVLNSTLLRRPGFSLLVAGAACLVYGALALSDPATQADPGRGLKFALLAAIGFFSVFMITYANGIERHTAEPFERRIAWLERLSLVGKALAGILHEVKTPLGTIVLGVENVRGRLRRGESVETELGVIVREANRASEILVNFLEFTRPAELALSPLPIKAPLDAVVAALRVRLEERGVALEYSPSDVMIQGSERHLIQAFMNLFMNAIDAMPDGGRLSVRHEQREGRVRVRITDTGTGIAAEELDALFESAAAPRPGRAGFGLGLGITRWIVQRHGGELRIESPGPGLGASATVSLSAAAEI
ncbi:MAG: HAMP domain-containing histidine kinase [Elusimicrobia bacterium]|nr:HAMP domain-containing histidine kinase [Elusimicrobiota bacterium]